MKDELQVISDVGSPSNPPSTLIAQVGDKNTQVAHANQVNTIQNIYLVNNSNESVANNTASQVQHYFSTRSKEFYNLFVIGGEKFDNNRFFVPPDRALTESITSILKDRFATLDEQAKEQIKAFPSLFMSELDRKNTDQEAYYGFVTEITVQKTGIRIEFLKLKPLPQIKLNEILQELALEGRDHINELHRTHWTIKQVDLLEELRIAGYSMH